MRSIAVYGLTGGIGAGKSTVARMLAAAGIEVVSSDAIGRDVVVPGSDGLQGIVQLFGSEILDAHGALDRKRLGTVVFGDTQARKNLEALLHPLIRERSRMRFAELEQQGLAMVIYESALLFEAGRAPEMEGIVFVTANDDVRIARIFDRDHCSEDEARSRIKAQQGVDENVKRNASMCVIDNSGTRAQLEAAVAGLVGRLRATD